eukprot:CAMPEP_0205942398 /NCGR_PEP_ID=MMETSP1325-20131115/57406_1 /ASSEMBLY_ACC=CAM_ASM_000708 /TAXON_ID=236786 /ORGANISM="Florenciella sp., Strain RCC1007" /LENGTH=46 /DNA_ID= /DNA_START= /DNA_END= /DNA_ORIENTATION=
MHVCAMRFLRVLVVCSFVAQMEHSRRSKRWRAAELNVTTICALRLA